MMTLSLFACYVDRLSSVRAERMMDAAQAAVYPHAGEQGARRMWSAWSEQVNRAVRQAAVRSGALFSVDGKATGVAGLRRWFRRVVGAAAGS